MEKEFFITELDVGPGGQEEQVKSWEPENSGAITRGSCILLGGRDWSHIMGGLESA